MPKVTEIAREVLGEVVANLLNTEDCSSAEEFLRRYDVIKAANKHTIGEQNMTLLRCAIISKYRPLVRSGQQLSQRALERTIVLRTGSSQLDKLLGGGLYTCEVVEAYGPAGKGKTQLALHTTVLACLKRRCNVLYVDTSNCFSSERVTEIFKYYKATEEAAVSSLKKIMVFPIFDVFELQDALHDFISTRKSKSNDFNARVKLIVIDNITSLLSPILIYKSSEGYTLAGSVASLIRQIAVTQNIAILIINGTVTGQTARNLPKPALGLQWQHTADKQILMSGYNQRDSTLYSCQLVANRKRGLM